MIERQNGSYAKRRSAFQHRPTLLLPLIALGIALVVGGAVIAILRVPTVSLVATPETDGRIRLSDASRTLVVSPHTRIEFARAGGAAGAVLTADMTPNIAEPRGDPAENREYQRARDWVAAALSDGPVWASAGNEHLALETRARTLGSLGLYFWLPLASGALALLAGLWVWALRPLDWAPRMFALSGVALFVGCVTLSWLASTGLSLSGTADRLMVAVNYASAFLFAGALAAIFARFPVPLVSERAVCVAGIVALIPASVVLLDVIPDAIGLGIITIVALCALVIGTIAAQCWGARRDPVSRAALLPIASGTGIATALYCVFAIAPQFAGGPTTVGPDMATPLLLLIYLGLGVAVRRTSAFALGGWALGILLSAGAMLVFLLTDVLLLATVTSEPDVAIAAAAMVFALAYVPLREWILRRRARAREAKTSRLLQLASDLAFAGNSESLQLRWHAAISALFEPLDVEVVERAGETPTVLEDGKSLYLPAVSGVTPLLLHYAGRGTRIFNADDLRAAEQFASLVGSLIEARDSYVRGAAEERERIARDLHDDVSSRLMTSLHRRDRETMSDDVRDAIADIRTIVSGLAGAPCALDALLADLRYESQTRLEVAGISLTWPITSACEDRRSLGYTTYRHLISIIRESMSNIVRHAQANAAMVVVDIEDVALRVTISDNGRGIDAQSACRGQGLKNMHRRASELGGTFDLKSDASGLTVTLVLPLPNVGDSPHVGAQIPSIA